MDDRGHLIDPSQFDETELKKLWDLGYLPVPDNLERAARLKLKGRKGAWVSRTSGGKLSRYAAAMRKKKRKIAQASRRRNRQ